MQIPISKTFHYKKNGLPLQPKDACEHMMQRYYLAAHSIMLLNKILLQNLRSRLFPIAQKSIKINKHFNEVAGYIDIAKDVFSNNTCCNASALHVLFNS